MRSGGGARLVLCQHPLFQAHLLKLALNLAALEDAPTQLCCNGIDVPLVGAVPLKQLQQLILLLCAEGLHCSACPVLWPYVCQIFAELVTKGISLQAYMGAFVLDLQMHISTALLLTCPLIRANPSVAILMPSMV